MTMKREPLRPERGSWAQRLLFPVLIPLTLCALWAALCAALNIAFGGATAYNSYGRQAMAWRNGRFALEGDVPYLELAIYQGNYYVSFPPLPSLVLLPLTFLFDLATPDTLLVKLYAVIACEFMYAALRKKDYSRGAAFALALLIGFSSCLLPLTLNGAVWYHAQMLAWALMMTALACLVLGRPTPALLLCALSVACRPFDALYLIPMYLFALTRTGESPSVRIRRLVPGTLLGLLVAAAIAVFNYARFGSPLEFGHNYLPEFSTQGGVQFSLEHVLNNARTFIWGLPFDLENGVPYFKKFGYSFLLACPALTLTLVFFIRDCVCRRVNWVKITTVLTMLLHLFLLLLHRTFGGFQLGARYACDLLPYAFLYFTLTKPKKGWNIASILFLLCGFAFTVWGVTQVHL